MPNLVPMTGTVVIRDGKRVRPQIGKSFNFTKDEVKDLEAAKAKLRKPSDEADEAAPDAASATAPVGPSAEASQAKARGGKKKATAETSDAEAAADAAKGDEDEDL